MFLELKKKIVVQIMTGLDLHEGLEAVWSTQGRYATETFTNRAVDFINNYNESAPYFLVVSHLAPHAGKRDVMEVPNVDETNQKYSYISNSNRRLNIGTQLQLKNS